MRRWIRAIEPHFLNFRNQVKVFSQKVCAASLGIVLGGEAISLAMQDVHDNDQNAENQEDGQQQTFA
jgi:hypothetical protein